LVFSNFTNVAMAVMLLLLAHREREGLGPGLAGQWQRVAARRRQAMAGRSWGEAGCPARAQHGCRRRLACRIGSTEMMWGLLVEDKMQNWMGIENEECNGGLTFILQLWSNEESNNRGSPRSRRSWPAVTRGGKKI
jgi:hypothetical protein